MTQQPVEERPAPKFDEPELNPSSGAEQGTTAWFTPLRFALILGVFLCAAFPKVVLGWESFFYRDYGVLGYPFIFHQRESFWRGELPLWNPYSNCGAPFLAQWGTMTLYPLSLIYLIFPLPWSLGVFCLGHLFLGGLGMFFLARRWTGNPFAASVAGLAFVFNGITFSCLLWPNYTVALGWMPWVVLCVERAWREGGRGIVVAAMVSALQLLSGVPELVLLTWLVVAVFWAGELTREAGARLAMAMRLGFVVTLVAGLTAAQLLPFFDLLQHSQRDAAFASSKWAMPAWGLANLLVPVFHCFRSFLGPYVQGGQEFLSSYYLGAGVLVLAIGALWRTKHWRVWGLAGLVVFGFAMAMGENGPVYPWLKRFIPALGVARYPVKFVMLAAFAVPLLAAFAVSRDEGIARGGFRTKRLWLALGGMALLGISTVVWLARAHPYTSELWSAADNLRAGQLESEAVWKNAFVRAAFLIAVVGVVLLLPNLAGSRWQKLAQCGLLALLGLDALTRIPTQNPTLPAAAFQPGLWEAENKTPLPRLGEGRVLISPGAENRLLYSGATNAMHDFLGKRLALWSNLNLLDEAPKVNGSSTLQLREQAQVQSLLYGTNKISAGLIDFLAVSLISRPDNPTAWFTNGNHSPLATAGQMPLFDTPENILQAIAAPEFDPRQVVHLPPSARGRVSVTQRTNARIVSQRCSAHALEFEVEADEASLVVVAQSFFHPWRASVSGQPAPLLRANHAFQAVEIPAGRHTLKLVYRDGRFLLGGALSILTLTGCLIWWRRARAT